MTRSTVQKSVTPYSLAHALRLTRNYVHPGRPVRERPWVEPGEEEYMNAEAIYTALLSVIIVDSVGEGLPEN